MINYLPFVLWLGTYTQHVPEKYWEVRSEESRYNYLAMTLDSLSAYADYLAGEGEQTLVKIDEIKDEIETIKGDIQGGGVTQSQLTEAIATLEGKLNAKATELNAKIEANTTNIAKNTQDITTEVNRAKAAEAKLQSNIDNVTVDTSGLATKVELENEVTRAKAAEAQLQKNIDAIETGGGDLTDYVTKTELETKMDDVNALIAKKLDKNDTIEGIGYYATEEEAQNAPFNWLAIYPDETIVEGE